MTDREDQRLAKTDTSTARYSERMADLFASLAALPPLITEDGTRRSPEDNARAAKLRGEIKLLSRKMFEFRERTGGWHEKRAAGSPEDERRRKELEAELLNARGRLCKIADAQARLVEEWNLKRTSRQDGFVLEYRQLAQDYAAGLRELERLRERLASFGEEKE